MTLLVAWFHGLSPRSFSRSFLIFCISYSLFHGSPHSSLRHVAAILKLVSHPFRSPPRNTHVLSFTSPIFLSSDLSLFQYLDAFRHVFHRKKRLQRLNKFNWGTDRTFTTPTTIFLSRPQFVANHGLQCLLHSVLRKVLAGVFFPTIQSHGMHLIFPHKLFHCSDQCFVLQFLFTQTATTLAPRCAHESAQHTRLTHKFNSSAV